MSIAERLNHNCQCIAADTQQLPQQAGSDWSGSVARYPVFVAQRDIDTMTAVVEVISELSGNHRYRALVEPMLPTIVTHPQAGVGVLFGFDFHLTANGPKLIEVNTNAGAAYLNHVLRIAQRPCCDAAAHFMRTPHGDGRGFEAQLLDMFLREFALQRPGRTMRTIAILDEVPERQFLYPEFLLFKELFERVGIRAHIASPKALHYDGNALRVNGHPVDLIYNRHTDFYLQGHSLQAIRRAYLHDQVVLTPNPRAYGLSADKRLGCLWSDPDFLADVGLNRAERTLLQQTIPNSERLSTDNADRLWAQRKQKFFKPLTGFGSRACYHGAKVTRGTWADMVTSDNYIGQDYVPPSRRTLTLDGESRTFKLDVRNYTYNGAPLMLAARLYRGQATNLQTPGGGLATVYGLVD